MYVSLARAVSEDFQFLREYPNIDVSAVFDSWVQNPGSPVIKVEVNTATGDFTVSQVCYVKNYTSEI